MNENDIILERNDDGRLTVSKEIADKLKSLMAESERISLEENEIRAQILDSMVSNNIDKCMSEGLTFTQIMPKPKTSFDIDSFLLNESEDIVRCFTSFEETSEFDFEAFKKENPELCEKYMRKKIVPTVDQAKMQVGLPTVFSKYYSEEPSDKPSTLRVGMRKEKTK